MFLLDLLIEAHNACLDAFHKHFLCSVSISSLSPSCLLTISCERHQDCSSALFQDLNNSTKLMHDVKYG